MLFSAAIASGGKNGGDSKKSNKEVYQIKEHVIVVMKDGREIEAVVNGHISKKKYWVREVGSKRQGKVKAKYMRPVSEKVR